MLASVDWSNLSVAAAFVVGAVLATLATILVFRHVLGYMKHERDR